MGHVFNVVGHAAHDIAVRMGIQIFNRKIYDLVKQLFAHAFDNALAQVGTQ